VTIPSCRDPELLHPLLRDLWVRFMAQVRAAGLNPVLTFAYRSPLHQDRLYQIGRRGIEGERTVTNARAGESWHNVERDGQPASLAFDVALMARDGKRLLSDGDEGWQRAGLLGEALGLTWGGRWPSLRDYGHFQLDQRGGLALAQAMAGTDPDGGGDDQADQVS